VQKRDMTVASASGGGYLVDTENLGFIDLLRNRSVAFNMGATRLSGLTGNITVPKQTSGATAYWLSTESTQITEGNQVFGQMALSPKTVGAYTEISRQLLLQSSPDAESIVTADLAAQVATAADLAVLNGSGAAGQPTGIIGTSGVGSTTATTVDYGKVLDFQADLAAANVFPMAGGYVTTSAVAKILMTKQRFSSTDTPLWEGTMWDGRMTGFRAMSSEQIPSGYMIFGDWSKVVVGEWGVLEVNVNPFANFQAGIIGVRAMYTLDVGVRYAAAFSVSTSVTA
jgi:HK97 family phage major capsid protein